MALGLSSFDHIFVAKASAAEKVGAQCAVYLPS